MAATRWRPTCFAPPVRGSFTWTAACPGSTAIHPATRRASSRDPWPVLTWLVPAWPRRRGMSCWSAALRRRRRPSSPPSWRPSSRPCATTPRRPGGATSTSWWPTLTAPVPSTLSTSSPHSSRYPVYISFTMIFDIILRYNNTFLAWT